MIGNGYKRVWDRNVRTGDARTFADVVASLAARAVAQSGVELPGWYRPQDFGADLLRVGDALAKHQDRACYPTDGDLSRRANRLMIATKEMQDATRATVAAPTTQEISTAQAARHPELVATMTSQEASEFQATMLYRELVAALSERIDQTPGGMPALLKETDPHGAAMGWHPQHETAAEFFRGLNLYLHLASETLGAVATKHEAAEQNVRADVEKRRAKKIQETGTNRADVRAAKRNESAVMLKAMIGDLFDLWQQIYSAPPRVTALDYRPSKKPPEKPRPGEKPAAKRGARRSITPGQRFPLLVAFMCRETGMTPTGPRALCDLVRAVRKERVK